MSSYEVQTGHILLDEVMDIEVHWVEDSDHNQVSRNFMTAEAAVEYLQFLNADFSSLADLGGTTDDLMGW